MTNRPDEATERFETGEAWRHWPLERREAEYSPSMLVPNLDRELELYRTSSVSARLATPPIVLAYGAAPCETLDLFLPSGPPPYPALAYIHGGYWQELTKSESAFMVPGLLAQGVAVAVIDYGLAPVTPVVKIIDQCVRAVKCLSSGEVLGNASTGGGVRNDIASTVDPGRVVISGSSAGAQLAALVLERVNCVRGGVLLSGIYDLRPLIGTYVNDALALDEAGAAELSPLCTGLRALAPLLVAVAERETSEFLRQSAAFACAERGRGRQVRDLVVSDRHHFDLPYDLGDTTSVVGRTVLEMLNVLLFQM